MARNLSLAMGLIQAPVQESKLTRTPSWSKNAIARAFETISLIAAAGRVGAAVEAAQPVGETVACGQHDQADVAPLPDDVGQCEPISPRQHDVDDDQIGPVAVERLF